MSVTALINFKISNDFFDWEKGFYDAKPAARTAGVFALYHGYEADNPKKCIVVVRAPSGEVLDQFFEEKSEAVAASGHILESTEVTIYKD